MKKVILVIGVITILFSCSKMEESINPDATTSGYLPMAVGNYWIYQENWEREGDTVFHASTNIDSTSITKDTIINGRTFYRFDNYQIGRDVIKPGKLERTSYFADSAKQLINPKGEIMFSEKNFTDVLYKSSDVIDGDTATWLTFKMDKLPQTVTVPAGSFSEVLNVNGTVICSPNYTNIPNPRYVNRYYAKNVGKIMHSYIYVQGGGVIERRLIRYKINQ